MPVILICVFMLVAWIKYETSRSSKINDSNSEAFWIKESQANHTRNKTINKSVFIKIPINELPFVETCDEVLIELQTTLKDLATKDILDLSDYSNTELKLKYGTGQFAHLADCDANYYLLIQTLNKLADYHIQSDHLSDAESFLEFAVACKTDVSKTYLNLANIYLCLNQSEKLLDLIHTTESLHIKTKDYILKNLYSLTS